MYTCTLGFVLFFGNMMHFTRFVYSDMNLPIYTQWTRKLSPPLLDAVKVKVFFCWSNSDIMANTNANIL